VHNPRASFDPGYNSNNNDTTNDNAIDNTNENNNNAIRVINSDKSENASHPIASSEETSLDHNSNMKNNAFAKSFCVDSMEKEELSTSIFVHETQSHREYIAVAVIAGFVIVEAVDVFFLLSI